MQTAYRHYTSCLNANKINLSFATFGLSLWSLSLYPSWDTELRSLNNEIMDIFSIKQELTTEETFQEIMRLSWDYTNLNGLVFSTVVKSYGHFAVEEVLMLVVPLPWYNNEWSNQVFHLCLQIDKKYPYIHCCHYDKLIEQVKLPGGGKCEILFYDARKLRILPGGQKSSYE